MSRTTSRGLAALSAIGLMICAQMACAALAATQPSAAISPDAAKLLQSIKTAYGSLKHLQVSGSITMNSDIDGVVKTQQSPFTAIYSASGEFRSELPGLVVIGNNGKQQYALDVNRKQYVLHDAPAAPARADGLDSQIADLVHVENLSLFLALCRDAAGELTDQAATVTKVDDTMIGDSAYPTLKISSAKYPVSSSLQTADLSVAVDGQTHLVRRATFDMTKASQAAGARVVKTDLITMEYEITSTSPVDGGKFAWTPPVDSHPLVVQQPVAQDTDPQTLVGNAAPAFTAKGLDGKMVSDTDLKGSVYVLDFWATWCGPCRASLPGLNKIYDDLKDKGLQVYAVNQGEDKDTVEKFVANTTFPDNTKLTIPVLLDGDQKVGQSFAADAIPETVVVGKDGKVAAVFVGSGKEDDIRAAVLAAMK